VKRLKCDEHKFALDNAHEIGTPHTEPCPDLRIVGDSPIDAGVIAPDAYARESIECDTDRPNEIGRLRFAVRLGR